MQMKRSYRVSTVAFGIAASVVVFLSALLTYAKERYVPLHDMMAGLTGHHWVTHSLADLFLFLLLGILFRKKSFQNINPVSLLFWSVLISVGIVGATYLPY